MTKLSLMGSPFKCGTLTLNAPRLTLTVPHERFNLLTHLKNTPTGPHLKPNRIPPREEEKQQRRVVIKKLAQRLG